MSIQATLKGGSKEEAMPLNQGGGAAGGKFYFAPRTNSMGIDKEVSACTCCVLRYLTAPACSDLGRGDADPR
jgi:hypothetical protein